jgi:hypothetical protein
MEMNNISLVFLVQFIGFVLVHGDNGKNLFKPRKLEMFVDELPDMPKLQGYRFEDGVPVAGNLTIGMYDTTWVCIYFPSHLFGSFSNLEFKHARNGSVWWYRYYILSSCASFLPKLILSNLVKKRKDM